MADTAAATRIIYTNYVQNKLNRFSRHSIVGRKPRLPFRHSHNKTEAIRSIFIFPWHKLHTNRSIVGKASSMRTNEEKKETRYSRVQTCSFRAGGSKSTFRKKNQIYFLRLIFARAQRFQYFYIFLRLSLLLHSDVACFVLHSLHITRIQRHQSPSL